MKIKKIKNITIGDIDWSIKWESKRSGGSFSYLKKEIVIGTQLGEIRMLSTIIHELKEIIQSEQSTRFDRYDVEGDYMFVYNHSQHTDLCARLAGLLNKFI